jgi:hypothetical protein
MPAAKPPASPPPREPAARQSPRWRNIATVCLILHFFCMAISIAVNAGGNKSLVGQALRRVPLAREYLQLLMMDLAYDFRLAGADADDGVHRLQLVASNGPAAPDAPAVAELPSEGMTPRIRRQRYQQLAYHVAYFDELFTDNADLRTQLPLAIAGRWVRDLKTEAVGTPYALRCFRIPSKRLPKAIEADITYAYVMREGGLAQQVVEAPPPPPINVFLVWDPLEERYQGSREAPIGERTVVVRPAAGSPPAN